MDYASHWFYLNHFMKSWALEAFNPDFKSLKFRRDGLKPSSPPGRHLCSSAPVEPAHVGRVSEVGVDAAGDQHVALGLLVLDDVVEVGAGRQHGSLAQDFATQHHEQPHATQPLELLQL